jgi:probable F420-dependent oxidoreductase
VNVKFGIKLSHIDILKDNKSLLYAPLVEDLGFDSVWTGEHILINAPTYDAIVGMATMATLTSRITIGSAILILPLRPAATVAKALATIDHLSEGRVILGAGLGGEFEDEFLACGIPVRERGVRMDESIALMRRLWSERNVEFIGRFARLNGVSLNPPSVQQPIPIWIGGRSIAAMRRASTLGDGYIPFLFDPKQYQDAVHTISRQLSDANQDASEFGWGLQQYLCLADSKLGARQLALQRLNHIDQRRAERIVDKYVVYGTPDEAIRRLGDYIEAGVRHFVFVPVCEQDGIEQLLTQVAREIVPRLRGQAGSAYS